MFQVPLPHGISPAAASDWAEHAGPRGGAHPGTDGAHICIGAPHTRLSLILRTLLQAIVEQTAAIAVLSAKPRIERAATFERHVGFAEPTVRLTPRPPDGP